MEVWRGDRGGGVLIKVVVVEMEVWGSRWRCVVGIEVEVW